MTDLKSKLQIKDGMGGTVMNQPESVGLDFMTEPGDDYVIFFAFSVDEVSETIDTALAGLREDGLLWYCYPKKSSGIKTDINRDQGWAALLSRGYRGVRAISVNDVWTGLRFRERQYVAGKTR